MNATKNEAPAVQDFRPCSFVEDAAGLRFFEIEGAFFALPLFEPSARGRVLRRGKKCYCVAGALSDSPEYSILWGA